MFIFLKGTLNIDELQDEFFQRNLLSERELKEYVLTVHGKHFRSEKFLKLIIKKRRCKEFVACMRELPEHEHVYEKIIEFENNHSQMTSEGNALKGLSLPFLYCVCVCVLKQFFDKYFRFDRENVFIFNHR